MADALYRSNYTGAQIDEAIGLASAHAARHRVGGADPLSLQDIADLGDNPITAPSEDTPANWAAMGSGYAWYSAAGQLTDQPSQYGLLINYASAPEVTQIWQARAGGAMYIRSGNADGWGQSWAKVYDTRNKPTPAELGAVSKAGDTMTGNLTVIKPTYPAITVRDSTNDSGGIFQHNNHMTQVIAKSPMSGSVNYRGLSLYDKAGLNDISAALKLVEFVNGEKTASYDILHTGNLSALGLPQISTLSYVGAGTKGSAAAPVTLTLPFAPKIVVVQPTADALQTSNTKRYGGMIMTGTGVAYVADMSSSSASSHEFEQIMVLEFGTTVSWYGSYTADAAQNRKSEQYAVVAIG